MIRATEAVKYFEKLYTSQAVYLWGANGEVITKALCDKLLKSFGNGTYNKAYYDNKLRYGQGRTGADCSGAMCPISGFDTTAQGYYDKCVAKGNIGQIPKDKPCLVFKGKNDKKINHIGFYCGNGNVIEMKSSRDDCVKRTLKAGNWNFYGVPAWIEYDSADNAKINIPVGGSSLPTLRAGSCGEYVKAWQTYLSMCGFYKGAIDSIYGNQTKAAVMEWQKANGLVPDGVVGAECWKKLNLT